MSENNELTELGEASTSKSEKICEDENLEPSTSASTSASCAENGTNGEAINASSADGPEADVDLLEKFITNVRPLLTLTEESKENQITKLREVVASRVSDDPKFRSKKFYTGVLQELLYMIEVRNYSDANTLLREAIDEFKYNVDCKPKLDNHKEVKLRLKKIKTMKLKLWKLHKKAQKYLEKEVDFNQVDDEMNTAFIKEYQISKKIMLLKRKINELQEKPLRTGSKNEKKYTFKASEYPQINEALTKLVNEMLTESHVSKTDQKIRLLAAPDLATVHKIITEEMEKNKLCLYDSVEYSKRMLRKIGEDLKNRRRVDIEYGYEAYLRLDTLKPDTVIPIEEELQLEEKFKEHEEKARIDTENLIKQYAEQEKDVPDDNQTEKSGEAENKEVSKVDDIKDIDVIDEDMKDEEEEDDTDSLNSDIEDMDDDKENGGESSSSDGGIIDDSDDDIEIVYEQKSAQLP